MYSSITSNKGKIDASVPRTTMILIACDRTLVNEDSPHQQMIHHRAHGPKIWKVYSRRGKEVNA
jgi:hypothetical protein